MYFNDSTILFLDGQYLLAAEAKTDLYNQTMHYGYGVFEGIRSYETKNGVKVFKEKEHYLRLKKSADLINIPFDYNVDDLIEVTYTLLEKNNLKNAYIRPLIFCSPNMGLTRPNQVSIMICVWEWGAYLGEKLLNLAISSYCRPHPRSTKVEAKVCGNYVNSILASTEAKDQGFDEALLLDSDGYLAEGPGSNLFFEKNGALYTPQEGNILPGITRATVIEISKELGIPVYEGLYKVEEIENADSAFLCGTAAEIVGVNSINRKNFSMNWENSIGKKIQTAYKNLVLNNKNES